MKKVLITAVLFLIYIQSGITEQIDNIVLLDTSESMFPYYSGTIDYLIEDIVQKQLQSGDTFHLLSFNDFPEYEISRTIRSEVEIKEIFNRIFLLQPIGKYTDLISAFSFLYEYTDKLQLNSLKRIIILTDGIHDPPPESPYPVSPDNNKNIVKISENMRRQGWDVSLVQFPVLNQNSSYSSNSDSTQNESSTPDSTNTTGKSDLTENNLFPLIADTLDESVINISDNDVSSSNGHVITGAPEIIYPDNLGSVGPKFSAVFKFNNHASDSVLLKLKNIISSEGLIYDEELSIKLEPGEIKSLKLILTLPEWLEKGSYNTPIELFFDDNYRAYPRKGNISYFYDPEIKQGLKIINSRIILYIIIGLVLLSALIVILINIIKNYSFFKSSFNASSGNKSIGKSKSDAYGTPKIKNKHDDFSKHSKPGEIPIEMVVRNQNRHIGHRNIHYIGESHPRSVGGAGSEYFLIFIIETGKRIGEIVMENGVVIFIPKEKDFFPDLSGSKLINCLETPIRVVNKKGVETSIVFKEWISPVERLNRIMHLLDKQGLPDFKY